MRKLIMAGGLVLASAVGAQAADLIVDEAVAPMDTTLVSSSIYVQLLGGVALQGDVDYYDDYGDSLTGSDTFEAGYSLAGTIGVVVMDGLSVEADAMYTSREYDGGGDTFASASLMGNLKYTVPLNDMFSIYGAAGLGVIGYTLETKDTYNYGGLGYQLIAGVGAKLTDNITAIAEYRYQNTFDVAPWSEDDYYGIQAPTGTVLVGVKLAF